MSFDSNFLRPVDLTTGPTPPAKPDEEIVKDSRVMSPVNIDTTPIVAYDQDGNEFTVDILDGDTNRITDSEGNEFYTRDPDVNTAERVKTVSGLLDPGTLIGTQQQSFVEDAIRYGGYNNIVTTGQRDVNGRELTQFVNGRGESLGDLLISERIADPNKYTTREQMFMRSNETLRDMVNFYDDNASAADKARDIINTSFRANPVISVKELASSKEEFESYEFWRGHQGIKILGQQVKDLRKRLATEELLPEDRLILQEQLSQLENQTQELLISPPAYYGYTGQQGRGQDDRSFYEEVQDSFIGGLYQLEGNAAGFLAWAGDLANIEGLQAYGSEWATDNAADIYKYTEGNQDLWTIGGGGDALQFAANTVAQYGPQLGVILAAGKAGGLAGSVFGPAGTAIGATVGSLGTAFVLAVSSIYDEQPEGEKDPYIAAALAVPVMLLEKYGADKFGPLASKLSGKNVLTKDGYDSVVSTIAETFGETTEQAAKRLNDDIFNTVKEAGLDIQQLAAENLIARQGVRDALFHGYKSVGREAITEALQEGIQAGGVAATTSIAFDWKEIGKRMIEGGIIGGIAGGPFGLVEGVKQNTRVNQIVYNYSDSTRRTTKNEKIVQDTIDNLGGEITVEEAIKRTKAEDVEGYTKADGSTLTLNDLGDKEQATYKQAFKDIIFNPLGVLTGFRWNIVKDDISYRGETDTEVAQISALLGDLRGILTGNSISATAKKLTGKYLFGVTSEVDLAIQAGVNTPQELDALRRADPNTLTPNQAEVVARMRQEELDFQNKYIADLEARGIDLSQDQKDYIRSPEYFDNVLLVDPSKIDTDLVDIIAGLPDPGAKQGGFFGTAPKKTLGREFAEEYVNNLRNNPTSLSTIQTTEALGIGNNPQFEKYKIGGTARQKLPYIARRNGSRVSREGVEEFFVKKILKSKMSQASKEKMAAKLAQFLDMMDGQFGKIDNEMISAIQENALLMSQFAYMDTNFFANTVDLAYGMLRIKSKREAAQFFGNFAKAFAKGIFTDLQKGANKISGGRTRRVEKWEGKGGEIFSLARLTGHQAEVSETLQIEGANISEGSWRAKLSGLLYKLNLVEAYTDATKSAVSVGAWDDIMQLVEKVASDRNRGINSEGTRHAINRLRGYNVPVDRLVELQNTDPDVLNKDYILQMNDPTSPFYQEMMNIFQSANINYIDEFTARPETGTSPKVFEDERLRLFTQYKRFISHFTANQIPALWNRYISHGSPQVRYQVFTNIMLTLLLAYTAQGLKDLLKYGEEAPYLEEWEDDFWNSKYGRAVKYTGWSGTPQDLLESILRYRANQYDSHPERMFELLLGQSAVLNTAKQIATSKDPVRTIKGKTPFLGDIEYFRESLLNL